MSKSEVKYLYERYREKLTIWVAFRLPKYLVYWCYIRVVAKSGNAPCSICFKETCDEWTKDE